MDSNWNHSPETPNLGQIRRFLEPCDLEIWHMTLKNNRALLLCYFKQYEAVFIISSSYVNSNWSYSPETVKLGRDLCDLDLWHWPFTWMSLLSLVISPENSMVIRWWEHGGKGVAGGQTDRQTDWTIHRAAWSQLKTITGARPSLYLFNLKSCSVDWSAHWVNDGDINWLVSCALPCFTVSIN